jgi:hypothetical protein
MHRLLLESQMERATRASGPDTGDAHKARQATLPFLLRKRGGRGGEDRPPPDARMRSPPTGSVAARSDADAGDLPPFGSEAGWSVTQARGCERRRPRVRQPAPARFRLVALAFEICIHISDRNRPLDVCSSAGWPRACSVDTSGARNDPAPLAHRCDMRTTKGRVAGAEPIE